MVIEENKNLRPIILIFLVITFFVFALSFAVFYTTENFSAACGCELPPWVVVVSISSLGLFVGLITYYILSSHFLKEKKVIGENLLRIVDILGKDEGNAIRLLVENDGEMSQSSMTKSLGINKVKTSRIVSKLERKGIIEKEKMGMTNKIILNEELRQLFSD